MDKYTYNNIGIGAISMMATLHHMPRIPITKILLVIPLVSHAETLTHLKRRKTPYNSIERMIAENPNFASNFSERYYDTLRTALESLLLLEKCGYIRIVLNTVYLTKKLEYNEEMGDRAKDIFKAGVQIALLLESSVENLYLNLRIHL